MNLPRTLWLLPALCVPLGLLATAQSSRAGDPAVTAPPSDSKPAPKKPRKTPEKPAEGGTVTVTHLRRVVTGCHRVQEEGRSYCDAAGLAERTGETSVEFVALSPSGDAQDDDRVEVTFPKVQGRQTQVTKLPQGRWELQWKEGGTLRERFFVVPRDAFEISLESTLGLCEEAGAQCKLSPGKRQRRVEIPKVRALVD